MDKPFPIQMEEFEVGGKGGTQVKWDSAEGILVVWRCRYKLEGTNGINFMQAGLMFLQLLTDQQHYAKLWTAASIMKDKMADFGAQVATCVLGSSSSVSQPKPMSLALQPTHWV